MGQYIAIGVGGKGMGVNWVVEKAKTKNKMTQMAEFRVTIMISTCTHHKPIFHLHGLDRHVLPMGTISGPHCQIRALYWQRFTSREFTWSALGPDGCPLGL